MASRSNDRNVVALVILSMLVSAVMFVTVLINNSTGPTSVSNCQDIEVIKREIRTTLDRSKKTLTYRDASGITYYHAHPAERQRAIDDINQSLAAFAATPC